MEGLSALHALHVLPEKDAFQMEILVCDCRGRGRPNLRFDGDRIPSWKEGGIHEL